VNSNSNKKRYLNRLKEVEDLRIFSPVFHRMHEVANNTESSAADLANVILHDHAFTSKILKTANSSYYHYKGKITTLTSAIVVMGFNAIRNLALSISVFDKFRNKKSSKLFNFRDFWVHSLAVAITSHWLADNEESLSSEEAFVAGFLHDIGKLIISTFTPDDYDAIFENTQKGHNPLQAELKQIGMYHTDVGYHIGKNWDFPGLLLKIIRDHHTHVLSRSRTIMDIITFSNNLINATDLKTGEITAKRANVINTAKKFFGVDEETLDTFLMNLLTTIEETADELDITLDGEFDEAKYQDKKTDVTESQRAIAREQEELKSKKMALERERLLSNKLMQSYYDMDKIEDILLALAEGMFRELNIEMVFIFQVNHTDNTLEGGVGFGIDWQEKIKRFSYDLKKHRNVFTNSIQDKEIQQILDTSHKAYSRFVDPEFLKVFNITQFATFPFKVWGNSEAVVVTGFSSDQPMISEELVQVVTGLTFQAGMAVERITPRK